MIETHAHLDSEKYDEDREEVIKRAFEGGIEKIINISSDRQSLEKVLSLTVRYEKIYGSLGIQPHSASEFSHEVIEEIRDKAKDKKIVAIGETGLDYHYNFSLPEVQREVFRKQIKIARDLNLPLIVHTREAFEDTLNILKEEKAYETGGVIHCFTENTDEARAFIELGFYTGIGGAVTFKKAKVLQEAVKHIPVNRILLETDCPYMSPVPYRGKRNEPLYLKFIAEKIGEIKVINTEDVKKQTSLNALKLFRLS